MKTQILYEDNHILIINKNVGQLVQGDKTGDKSLLELLKSFIKERDQKPGNVFLGLVHRIDRPTSGLVIYAKTSKALSRLTQMIKNREIKKIYWAIVLIISKKMRKIIKLLYTIKKLMELKKLSLITKLSKL